MPQLSELGYQLVAISPDRPARLRPTLKENELRYTLFSDSRLAAAQAFGIAYRLDEATLKAIRRNLFSGIAAAVVKRGIGRYGAICLSPRRTQRLIREAVIDGLKRRDEIPPVTYKNPITVEIDHLNQFRAHVNEVYMLGDKRISPTRIKFTAENAREAYFGFLARNRVSAERHNIR